MLIEIAGHNTRVDVVLAAVVKPHLILIIESEELDEALAGFNAFHPFGE